MEKVYLYHATSRDNLESIMAEGLRARTYFSSEDDLTDYYIETVEDEGGDPVVLCVDLAALDEQWLIPDMPGIDEPITTAIGLSEKQVLKLWKKSEGTWRDSLEIINSVCYNAIIAPDLIMIEENGELTPLVSGAAAAMSPD